MFEIDARPFASFTAAVQQTLALIQERLGTGVSFVGRVDEDDWVIIDTDGDGSFTIQPGDKIDFQTTFCARMLDGRGPRLAPDASCEPAYAGLPIRLEMGIGTYLGVPIRLSNGELYGTLCALDHARRGDLSDGDVTFVESMARFLAHEVERERDRVRMAREQERLRLEAERDPLTGLANRRAWHAALAAERGRVALRERVVVLMFDLDGLKRRNDSEGHEAGDRLIRGFADALAEAARASDVVARLGGDEFGVLLFGGSPLGASSYVDRVRRRLAADASATTFCVGVATAATVDGLEEATRRADRALLEAKARRVTAAPTRSDDAGTSAA